MNLSFLNMQVRRYIYMIKDIRMEKVKSSSKREEVVVVVVEKRSTRSESFSGLGHTEKLSSLGYFSKKPS